MSIYDTILFFLWALLATGCIFNWTAQARWHKYYREEARSNRKDEPRIIKSPEQLAELGAGSVVRDADGYVLQLNQYPSGRLLWDAAGLEEPCEPELPATVLREPSS